MPIFKNFFYNKRFNGQLSTKKPAQVFLAKHYLEGKDEVWQSAASPERKTRKNIIITDWTARNWSIAKQEAVIAQCTTLLEKGFPLFIFCNSQCVPLNLDNIHLIKENAWRQITPIASDVFFKIYEQFPKTESKLLDDVSIAELFSDELPQSHPLYLSDYLKLNTLEREKLIKILRVAIPPVTEIIVDIFPCDTDAIEELSKRLAVENIILEAYQTLQVLPAAKSEQNFWNGSKAFKSGENLLWRSDLRAIKNFLMPENTSLGLVELKSLTEHAPKLERIELAKLSTPVADIPAYGFTLLQNLKTLTFNNDLPPSICVDLIAAAPNLKVLELNNNLSNSLEFFAKLGSLPRLEKLTFMMNQISDMDILKHLIGLSPNLIQLNLSFPEDKTAEFENALSALLENNFKNQFNLSSYTVEKNPDSYLHEIVKLNFKKTPGEAASFAHIEQYISSKFPYTQNVLENNLNTAKNLRVLGLHSPQAEISTLNLLPNNLLKLESLYLDANLLNSCLETLMTAAPSIKELVISKSYNEEIKKINSFPLALSKLESLSFQNTPLGVDDVQNIISQTPYLKKLHFEPFHSMYFDMQLKKDSLLRLNELSLKEGVVSKNALQIILEAAPNLAVLEIKSFIFGDEAPLQLTPKSLLCVHTIVLPDGSSEENLKSLLEATPNVETLIMNKSAYFEEPLRLEENSLPNLTLLDLSNACFNTSHLKKLLKAAPNLKVLNLTKIDPIEVDKELNTLLQRIPSIHGWKYLHSEVQDDLKHLSLSLSENVPPPALEKHDFADFRNYTPPEEKPFAFKNNKQFFDQAMINNKLSRYLHLKRAHLDHIPKIQRGMCYGLSKLFLQKSTAEWQKMLETINRWDGGQYSLTPGLTDYFEEICHYYLEYQCQQSRYPRYYHGKDYASLLSQLKPADGLMLSNPWHAIAVRRLSQGWEVYDPNSASRDYYADNETVYKKINFSLGNLILVENKNISPVKIDNIGQFIEEGGLLTLHSAGYKEILTVLENQLPSASPSMLDGLFMCNTAGEAAWSLGISHKDPQVRNFFYKLLMLYKQQHKDYLLKLSNSTKNYPNQKRQDIISNIINHTAQIASDSHFKTLCSELIMSLRTPAHTLLENYEKYFTTWDIDNAKKQPVSISSYCETCLAFKDKKNLIKFGLLEAKKGLLWSLEKHCLDNKRPYFVINTPEELVCFSSFIAYDEKTNSGVVHSEPHYGGHFYNFLINNKNKSPVVLIDYDKFPAEDIVRFNTIIDKKRSINNYPLEEDVLLIGLMDVSNPDCYTESDFSSRFDNREDCPVAENVLANAIPALPIPPAETPPTDSHPINLFNAPDWENQLLGHWSLDGAQLVYKEGKLAEALAQKKTIELQNAPWEDEGFVDFWQKLFLRKEVQTPRGVLHLDENLKFTKRDGYDWPYLLRNVHFVKHLEKTAEKTLSPGTYDDFFSRYELLEDKTLKIKDGIIAEAKQKKSLRINLTRAISINEWARLLDECQNNEIVLEIYCAPGVELPEQFPKLGGDEGHTAEQRTWNPDIGGDAVISSTEPDTTIAMICEKYPEDTVVIDVSECSFSDLIFYINGAPSDKNLTKFTFNGYEAALKTQLAQGKKVILKGNLSLEVGDILADLLLQRQNDKKVKGQLLVATNATDHLDFINPWQHKVTPEEKYQQLKCTPEQQNKIKDYIDEPLSRLKARLRHPNIDKTEDAWAGFYQLSADYKHLEPLDAKTSKEKAKQFKQARRKGINDVLATAPFAFVTGLSGVGKSTFIKNEFRRKNSGDRLYVGEDAIAQWASDDKPGRKILFIDEANLSQKQFSEFEGLFNKNPTILIDGKLIPLSPEHKVIFAGNPLSYGDERVIAPFFTRHGNAVVFEPLPPAVVYEKILKPVFANTLLAEKADLISSDILSIYQFFCECAIDDVLITPRELQMMALLIVNKYQQNPNVDLRKLVQEVVYNIAHPIVPRNKHSEFEALPLLQNRSKAVNEKAEMPRQNSQKSSFVITESRQNLYSTMNDLLSLCEWRSKEQKNLNKAQNFGGLGGLIVEGEPGVGKSKLIKDILKSRGYKQLNLEQEPEDFGFYYVPASLSNKEKEHILLKAFHGGVKVVMEEINSSPLLEPLLNNLLMGEMPGTTHTPDENKTQAQGKKAPDTDKTQPKAGFMVFGSQNSRRLAGRRAASPALERRLIKQTIGEYTDAEMKQILTHKGLPSYHAQLMVHAFKKCLTIARSNHYKPEPNFRNVTRLATKELLAADRGKINRVQPNSAIKPPPTGQIGPNSGRRPSKTSQLIQMLLLYKLKVKKDVNADATLQKQKADACDSFIQALQNKQHFIRFDQQKILINTDLKQIIQNFINANQPLIFHELEIPSLKNPEEFIHHLNQRHAKETFIALIKNHGAMPNKPADNIFSFFTQENSAVLTRLIKILSNDNTDPLTTQNFETLQQGSLGQVIEEFIASYNVVHASKNINSLQELVAIFTAENSKPAASSQQSKR